MQVRDHEALDLCFRHLDQNLVPEVHGRVPEKRLVIAIEHFQII